MIASHRGTQTHCYRWVLLSGWEH